MPAINAHNVGFLSVGFATVAVSGIAAYYTIDKACHNWVGELPTPTVTEILRATKTEHIVITTTATATTTVTATPAPRPSFLSSWFGWLWSWFCANAGILTTMLLTVAITIVGMDLWRKDAPDEPLPSWPPTPFPRYPTPPFIKNRPKKPDIPDLMPLLEEQDRNLRELLQLTGLLPSEETGKDANSTMEAPVPRRPTPAQDLEARLHQLAYPNGSPPPEPALAIADHASEQEDNKLNDDADSITSAVTSAITSAVNNERPTSPSNIEDSEQKLSPQAARNRRHRRNVIIKRRAAREAAAATEPKDGSRA